jgi:hypothetical protein
MNRDPFHVSESERRSYDLIEQTQREIRRDGWIINIIAFLLCFPLAWLLAKVMP